MELTGLLVLLSGGLLQWCSITGRSPLQVIIAIASSQAMPVNGTWFPIIVVRFGDLNITESTGDYARERLNDAQGLFSQAGSTGSSTTAARLAVVAFAKAQEGKPYIWDTAGPKTFDCSGLVLAAYKVVGINLPHLAAGQQKYGDTVSLAQAQPGDLVFWGDPATHVGIYVGNGQVIDAPHTGTVVKQQAIWDQKNIHIKSLLPTVNKSATPDKPDF